MPDQQLRPIPGFTDYFASPDGEVFSAKRTSMRKMSPSRHLDKTYLRVKVIRDGANGPDWAYVHKLVAAAFLPPRPSPKHEIRHLDCQPRNNSAANLKWGTREENKQDCVGHAHRHPYKKRYRKHAEVPVHGRGIQHGKVHAYIRWGCRCGSCSQAMQEARQRHAATKAATLPRPVLG